MIQVLVLVAVVIGLIGLVAMRKVRSGSPQVDAPGLRTHVRFVGGERYMDASEREIEDAIRGHGIAAELARALKEQSFAVSAVIDEDWGAMIDVTEDKRLLHVCAGFRGDDWVVYVCGRRGPDAPVEDSPLLRRLLVSIDQTLRRLEGIAGVSWHRSQDWAVGREELGRPTPLD